VSHYPHGHEVRSLRIVDQEREKAAGVALIKDQSPLSSLCLLVAQQLTMCDHYVAALRRWLLRRQAKRYVLRTND
jgi:hypothetical protein